jgi:predicted nucleic acid-binding protein
MTDGPLAESIRVDLAALGADRYPHLPLLERRWALRHKFTAYDAAYIALAEATGSTLYTADEKLGKGHRARVRLFRAEEWRMPAVIRRNPET